MTFTAKDFHAARRFVDTEFGRIAYVERGSGPAALFIHGALLNGYQWRHQLEGLSDIRRVIAPDSLAMGHTEMRPGQPLGLRAQAAMQRAFLEALGIDAADIVGNDSGGGAAQLLAAMYPDRVRSLTLTNCEVHDYDEDTPAALRFREGLRSGALAHVLQKAIGDPARAKKLFASAYQNVNDLPDDAIVTYAAPLIASPQRIDQMVAYSAATTKRDLIAVESSLRRLAAPVLVMWGTGDEFFATKWAYWLKENLPNVVEVVEIEGAPVFWPEERPELLNRHLRAFWNKVR